MKLLLMVDAGDGRVKCGDQVWPESEWHWNPRFPRHRCEGFRYTDAQLELRRSAARWWLVEAASAEDARELIDRLREYTDMGVPRTMIGQPPPGRIVVWGGRDA